MDTPKSSNSPVLDQSSSMDLSASIIDEMAVELESKAAELRRLAEKLRAARNIEQVEEAAMLVASLGKNMRHDLLLAHTADSIRHNLKNASSGD